MSEFYARLRPFDSKRDRCMRVFVLGNQRFDAGVWVPVTREAQARLRAVRDSYYDPESPPAFEVLTKQDYDGMTREAASVKEASGEGQQQSPEASDKEQEGPGRGRKGRPS